MIIIYNLPVEHPPDFEIRLSQLPAWAQKQVLSRPSIAAKVSKKSLKKESVASGSSNSNKPPLSVKGKWAEVGHFCLQLYC